MDRRESIAGKANYEDQEPGHKIIAYFLATSHDPAENGEELLITQIAGDLETIVDVGANKGDWTWMVKKYAPPMPGFSW